MCTLLIYILNMIDSYRRIFLVIDEFFILKGLKIKKNNEKSLKFENKEFPV